MPARLSPHPFPAVPFSPLSLIIRAAVCPTAALSRHTNCIILASDQSTLAGAAAELVDMWSVQQSRRPPARKGHLVLHVDVDGDGDPELRGGEQVVRGLRHISVPLDPRVQQGSG